MFTTALPTGRTMPIRPTPKTPLYDKIWIASSSRAAVEASGIYIDRHLFTSDFSAQAFRRLARNVVKARLPAGARGGRP